MPDVYHRSRSCCRTGLSSRDYNGPIRMVYWWEQRSGKCGNSTFQGESLQARSNCRPRQTQKWVLLRLGWDLWSHGGQKIIHWQVRRTCFQTGKTVSRCELRHQKQNSRNKMGVILVPQSVRVYIWWQNWFWWGLFWNNLPGQKPWPPEDRCS